jgi:ABC-type polar amino acid transport system ATPase subunit
MATDADFCWFDEPLEHLDPDVRRRVANLLARVTTTGGPLRQIVVTTYEEPLARQLEARDPLNVRLIDVRQAG